MRRRIIDLHSRLVTRQRRLVLLICLGFTGICAALLPRLEFRTARSALSSHDDPDLVRFEEFLKELGPNAVVLAAEGGTEADRRAFVEDLAARLQAVKGTPVGEVFYRAPAEFFQARALGLRPAKQLDDLSEALEKEAEFLRQVSATRGLADLHRVLRERMEREFRGSRRPEGEDTTGLALVHELVLKEKELLESPSVAGSLEGVGLFQAARFFFPRDADVAQLARDGFLTSIDGSLYTMVIRPRITTDAPEFLSRFLAAIREAASAALGTRPGVKYGLAGVPVTIMEEADTVARDAPLCSAYAGMAIALLATMAFRRKRAVVFVLVALVMGIVWNMALTWVVFGAVNLITASVPVILIALGIDFGIHVVIAYEAERSRGLGPLQAMEEALARVGPGLTTGAVTTALAFYAICFMEYRGFREFGVVAGNGVLVCLLAMATALPVLLVGTDRRPVGPPAKLLAAMVEELVADPRDLPPAGSRLRGFWRKMCRASTAFPLLSVLASIALTVWFLILAREIGFDYRVEDLLPANSESQRTQERLKSDERLSPDFAAVFVEDRAALEAADARAADQKEHISRRMSILKVLPEAAPEARRASMERFGRLLAPLRPDPARLAPLDRSALQSSLEELAAVFARALDLAATQEGLNKTKALLDKIGETLEEAAQVVEKAPPSWQVEMEEAQRRLWAWAAARQGEIVAMLERGPVLESELPPQIMEQLKGRESGRYTLLLYPKEDLAQRPAVQRFVQAARAVDPKATGYPVVFFASTSLIHQGFNSAVAAAAVVILVTLFLDFRRLSRVLLAVLPKGVGIIWMLGIMRLLGLNYNLANQIVIPLLIGVGLAFGIHIIHRFFMPPPEERDITKVLEHTGGAIALSGLTTMLGFGSLALASHRGLASMGMVLFFGVGAALITSTYVLSNVLVLLYRPRR